MCKVFAKTCFERTNRLFLAFFLIVSGCDDSSERDQPVLSINEVGISQYQFEKNLGIFKKGYVSRHGTAPPKEVIQQWIDSVTERTYLLAEAYRLGYHTRVDIRETVNATARIILTQRTGVFFSRVIDPQVKLQESEIRAFYEQQEKQKEDILSFHEVEPAIRKTLRNMKVQEIANGYIQMFLLEANVFVDSVVASQVVKIINRSDNPFELEEDKFDNILGNTLLRYSLSGEEIMVSVSDFLDYYKYQPVKEKIKETENLYQCLENWVVLEYFMMEVEKRGLDKAPLFLQDKKDFEHRVILKEFYRNEVLPKAKIDEEEVHLLYESSKTRYNDAEFATISVFSFDTQKGAYLFRKQLEKLEALLDKELRQRLNRISGLDNYMLHKKIHFETSTFPTDQVKMIFEMAKGQVSFPIQLENRYCIVRKESEEGFRIKNLDEVRSHIIDLIKKREVARLRDSMIKELKARYPLTNNINHSKYLN